jgi:hypothetical protein
MAREIGERSLPLLDAAGLLEFTEQRVIAGLVR